MFDRQQAYNTVRDHLLKQGRKSEHHFHEEPSCAYRGSDGLKCAIGVLIPDGKYDPSMEGEAAWCEEVVAAVGAGRHDAPFLMALQAVHDEQPPREWRAELAKVALKYDLEP